MLRADARQPAPRLRRDRSAGAACSCGSCIGEHPDDLFQDTALADAIAAASAARRSETSGETPCLTDGHIELERSVDSIVVGERHRRDPGDLTPLMDSIKRVGLLQPVTITPDGFLICGSRRLEAAKRLGWRTLRVWVRSGISDELTRLLAERDENVTHKPLSTLEQPRALRRDEGPHPGGRGPPDEGHPVRGRERRNPQVSAGSPDSSEPETALRDGRHRQARCWSPARRHTPGWSRSWRWSASPPTGPLRRPCARSPRTSSAASATAAPSTRATSG